jgi:effector-binding domain-containing protein
MINTPEITQSPKQLTAYIPVVVPRNEIQLVMGPGIMELMSTLAAQEIVPTGPWFTHHRKMDADTFDFEISIPVATPVAEAGRVKPGERRATKVARAIYHGPYEGLGGAWSEFMAWIAAEGHTPAPDLWECYLAGPESGPDPSTWRTELNRPLLG